MADPTLPLVYIDASYNSAWTRTADHVTTSAADFISSMATAAASNAAGSYIVEIPAGASYTGNFVLPTKTGSVPQIIIRSSAYNTTLPAPGTRVSPSNAAAMARLTCANNTPVLINQNNANNYRFIGIDFYSSYNPTPAQLNYNVVYIGDYNTYIDGIRKNTNHVTMDRCWIHPHPEANTFNGMSVVNVSNFAIVDSYLADVHVANLGPESHGIQVLGVLTCLVQNNFLSASGQNLFIGDNSPASNGATSDITIRGNYMWKDLAWQNPIPTGPSANGTVVWRVKNILEFKEANRALVEGNLMENVWVNLQNGIALNCTPRGADAKDITFRRNFIRNAVRTCLLNSPTLSLQNILLEDNIWVDLHNWWIDTGYSAGGTTFNMIIRHNTVIGDKNNTPICFIEAGGPVPTQTAVDGFIVKDNLMTGASGMGGTGMAPNKNTIENFCANYDVDNNGIFNVTAGYYPYTTNANYKNFRYAANNANDNTGLVGFTNTAFTNVGDFALLSTSPYKAGAAFQASDGKDMGADVAAVIAALNYTPPTSVAPTITSTNSYTTPENAAIIRTVITTGTPTSTITKAVGGDATLFTLTDNGDGTATWTLTAKDFEAPISADGSNVYTLPILVSNGVAPDATQTISVTITNVVETGTGTGLVHVKVAGHKLLIGV